MSDEPEAPRRKKPRRFTAPPQQVSESALVGVFQLPHGAGRPATLPSTDAGTGVEAGTEAGTEAAADAGGTADAAPATADAAPATAPTPAKPGDKRPVLDQQAAEDDPRRWGDGDDDLGDWLKSQRPPHWD
ncbi:hypothetical protein [Paeniglutamicibacter sulfureus]|uniref:Uncharacterized protein n=1 Tax=Paeniglutamicibacter sulfureus TaxID=43666 RepID=A0ABU2BPX2_9MICC|nr:hypothetical protein [Paeniglutamicibacter sulfureus]MDR7360044.1 hypothetical protein [Paeniglutamicibacter sulfureus]